MKCLALICGLIISFSLTGCAINPGTPNTYAIFAAYIIKIEAHEVTGKDDANTTFEVVVPAGTLNHLKVGDLIMFQRHWWDGKFHYLRQETH